MITIMGAGGNTGGKIATTLLAAGHPVRALGRFAAALAPLEQAGAEVMPGDTREAAFLTAAFAGADAAYTLLATDPRAPDYRARQDEEGEAIARAIRGSGVRHVVALSSLGADLPDAPGVIRGLHVQEERLRALPGVRLLLLRPASFFENFATMFDLIRHAGIVVDGVVPDLAIPMVATRDIAAVAAAALASRDWSGVVVRELLGPRDVSFREATRILGERIGRPDLPYVQVSYAELAEGLVQAGLSPSFAGLFAEMTRAFNAESIQPLAGRTPANTTPTGFEDVAGELAQAYAAQEAVGVA